MINENKLNSGTEEHIAFLEEMISNLQDVKNSLGVRSKQGKAFRKEASKLQGAINSLRYLRNKSEKLLLNGPQHLNENFTSDDIRGFFYNMNRKPDDC
jgi:hypothetical protein